MIRYRDLVSDTICSAITPPGYSGVAVLRVSGERSLEMVLPFFPSLKDSQPKSHRAYFGQFLNREGKLLDEVLITYFEKGKSFTGDQSLEISCHGNPLLVNKIIDCLLSSGCRLAEKGEFSFRAFYNGKIDLVQAEAINSLIKTSHDFGSESFLKQLEGKLSDKFKEIQDFLITALAHLEASIDFVEEDIDPQELQLLKKPISEAHDVVSELLGSYSNGKVLNESFKISLLGPTNAGKSSLFNKLVEEERAIVTEQPGTTRDIVSDKRFLGDMPVEFLDTAGIRETSDHVETIGIEKSLALSKTANLILYLIDIDDPVDIPQSICLPKEKTIMVFNKIDLSHDPKNVEKVVEKYMENNCLSNNCVETSLISAETSEGIDTLKSQISIKIESIFYGHSEDLTQARHFDHLSRCLEHLNATLSMLDNSESPDLLSQELQLGLSEINGLLGKECNDEILDKIFSDFCIGK